METSQNVAAVSEATLMSEPLSLLDRLLALRDRIYSNPTFHRLAPRWPVFRQVALARSRQVFDICAGFTYTQTLTACLDLQILEYVRDQPRSALEVAANTGLTLESITRLLDAAVSLGILGRRSAARYGLGRLGGPILAQPSVRRMARHNMLLYQDLMRPVELLTRAPGSVTAVGSFFPYAETAQPDRLGMERSETYSALMSDTITPIADDVISSGALDGCRVLLDVGGGNGQFLEAAGTRLPSLEELRLFDLPSVVEGAVARFRASPVGDRFRPSAGNFHDMQLPDGNDAVTLIRILLDHDEQKGVALLKKVRASLNPGGRLIVAEPMKGIPGAADRTADVYFSFYLYAMGRGRSRHVDQLRTMLQTAGFTRVRRVRETYPVFASLLVAEQ